MKQKLYYLFLTALLGMSGEYVCAQESERLSFGVISDIHIENNTGEGAMVKVPKALKNLTSHKALDALLIVGDVTNGGKATEYSMVSDVFNDEANFINPVSDIIFMMGNHDNVDSNGKANYQDGLKSFNGGEAYPFHQYKVIKGYPFITISQFNSAARDTNNEANGTLSYPEESVQQLEAWLERASQECPGKPIFVFTHVAPRWTVYGSWLEYESNSWCMKVLNPILNKYPQAVVFTGHSHYPLGDPRSIHQGANPNSTRQNYYTVINTASVTYSELNQGAVSEGTHPAGYEYVTEGMIVNELENGDIEIVRYDTYRDVEIGAAHRWVLKAPFDGSMFEYADIRDADDNPNNVTLRTGLPAPVFAANAEIEVQPSIFNATAVIPQATDDECVFRYRIRLNKNGQMISEKYVFSQFYLTTDMPDQLKYSITNLTPNTEYELEVVALDSYDNASEPLTVNFKTPATTAENMIPAPDGKWTFEDETDLLKVEDGSSMSMQPYLVGTKSVTLAGSLTEAGIVRVDGPVARNKAIKVPQASALRVNRPSGSAATQDYTIMMDIKVEDASPYISLIQTLENNNNDGDLFYYQNKIGISQVYGGTIVNNTWHRVVILARGGQMHVYVDGAYVNSYTIESRWVLDPWGFYLFCDESNEMRDVEVAEVAYWEAGLSDEQVKWLSYHKISNANDLTEFADWVNNGYNTANAYLAADIDMVGKAWSAPIGLWGSKQIAYKGHFDGQGHTISNLSYTTAQNYHGLFGVVSTGADIENFTVSGTIRNASYNQFGAVGFARDNGVSLRNIHSCLDIINTGEQKTIGGILGHVYNNSTVSIDRCTYSGTLQVTDTGGDDGMYGGILGHAYNNANAKVSITNCLFDGKVTNTVTGTSGCTLGGIVGWLGTYVSYSIDNCLSVGDVSSTVCGQISGALMNNGISFSNNYYKGAVANGSVSKSTNKATSVTDGQLASGEVAVKLGGAYGQTLGSDAYPVLDASAPKVYEIAVGPAGYASFVPEANILAIPTGVTAYAGQKKDGDIQLEQVSELPADNAVVVKANEGAYYCNSTDEARTLGTSNDLTFSETGIAADGSQYILANVGGLVGFYQATTGTIPARKAYFISTNGVKAFYFAEEEETAISRPTPNPSRQGWEVYDLAGRKVQVERCKGQENSSQLSPVTSQLKKGIYIVNGKKVLK